jgi:adenine-specific DNA-methyltransferase
VAKPTPDAQKLRGGYYTPPPLARLLADWAIRNAADRVLEPSSGDGAFLAPATRRLRQLGASEPAIEAVEIDRDAARLSRAVLNDVSGARIHEGDFFQWAARSAFAGEKFDAVIGNPPFLRFAYFQDAHREVAFDLMRRLGLRPTKLTNAWVAFVAVACSLLTENGRLAMVLPAELLQVTYAADLRRFLAEFFERITLVTFDSLIFEGVQQEVVLLAAERQVSEDSGIHVIEAVSGEDLSADDLARSARTADLDHGTEKWTQYFLDTSTLELVRQLRASPGLSHLSEFGQVDVGVVTGANDFFVLDANGTTDEALKAVSVPIITRSHQLRGASITSADWDIFLASGDARLLLNLNSDEHLDPVVRGYLADGVTRGVPLGYKCRVRQRWYSVPSAWRPSGFMLRQIHSHPRLVINETPATSTDTVHRVAFNDAAAGRAAVSAFHNSATFLFAEIEGRSYGGGVLELEPSEAERLLLPTPKGGSDLSKVDAALRSNSVDGLLSFGDAGLMKSTGISDTEVVLLRLGWDRLRTRRTRRKHKPSVRG